MFPSCTISCTCAPHRRQIGWACGSGASIHMCICFCKWWTNFNFLLLPFVVSSYCPSYQISSVATKPCSCSKGNSVLHRFLFSQREREKFLEVLILPQETEILSTEENWFISFLFFFFFWQEKYIPPSKRRVGWLESQPQIFFLYHVILSLHNLHPWALLWLLTF